MPNDTFNQEALTEAHINIAVLQTKVEAQGREIGELKAMIQTLGIKLDAVANTLTEARGGWKLMMLLGGGTATTAAGNPKGWICTVAGTPGTWVSTVNL